MPHRTTVLIPVTPLDGGPGGGLLEVIAEDGAVADRYARQGGGRRSRFFHHLRGHGLEAAALAAERALAVANLPPASGVLRRRLLGPAAGVLPAPAVFLANPMPGLSNTLGAGLGLALLILTYEGRCPGARLVASGRLEAGTTLVGPTHGLYDKLRLVLALGAQPAPLPFLVPAEAEGGVGVAERHAGLILELARRNNVHVRPVASLEAAVAACGVVLAPAAGRGTDGPLRPGSDGP